MHADVGDEYPERQRDDCNERAAHVEEKYEAYVKKLRKRSYVKVMQ